MADIRVYQLAEELQVDSRDLLRIIPQVTSMSGVSSVGSQIQADDAVAVRAYYEERERERLAERERRVQEELRELRRKSETAASLRAEQEMRLETHIRRPAHETEQYAAEWVQELSRRTPRPPLRRPGRPRRGTRALDSWDRNFVDPAEKREWMGAGLGPNDYEVAKAWAAAGMTIEDLRVTIALDGRTAAQEVARGGSWVESVAEKVRAIRQA